jgi:hypothetical protein
MFESEPPWEHANVLIESEIPIRAVMLRNVGRMKQLESSTLSFCVLSFVSLKPAQFSRISKLLLANGPTVLLTSRRPNLWPVKRVYWNAN